MTEFKKKWGPGYIYLVEAVDLGVYKIGHSTNPTKRIYQLDYLVPFPIRLLHTIYVDSQRQCEDYFHRIFREWHIKGEWFRLTPGQVEAFCQCKGKSDDDLALEMFVTYRHLHIGDWRVKK